MKADNNIENVEKFFELLEKDAVLKAKLDEAVEAYPGSYEIRECLCQETLIPIAAEAGFPFEISDLRKYETRKKMRQCRDVEIDPNEPDEETVYWLLDRGWEEVDEVFKENTDTQ